MVFSVFQCSLIGQYYESVTNYKQQPGHERVLRA
jgi:hypothetical protein